MLHVLYWPNGDNRVHVHVYVHVYDLVLHFNVWMFVFFRLRDFVGEEVGLCTPKHLYFVCFVFILLFFGSCHGRFT